MRKHVVSGLLVVVLASAVPASSAATSSGRYTVRAGDTLTEIAQHYDVSFQRLAALNGLDWRKPLLVGVVLRVPSSGSAAPGWTGSYVVRSGDTLSGIALRFHVSLPQLASANNLDPARVLLVGVGLKVPAVGGEAVDLAHVVQSDPYPAGSIGDDVSFPSCANPSQGSHPFALIGLNAGRPFTANPCFASEWQAATAPRSVYINTAFGPSLARHVTQGCAQAGRSQPLAQAAQRAYAIGCSEALAAEQMLGAISPLAIWLDVEPANTWSSQPSLNDATIKGILDRLFTLSPRPRIGIYSKPVFWRQIAGDWRALSVPEWIAVSIPDPPGCRSSFAAGPVWLSQSIDGPLDLDTAC